MKYLKYLFGGICVSYFPAIFIFAVFMPTSFSAYWLNLLVVFLISAPYYFAFIQLGLFLSYCFKRPNVKKRRKILSIIGTAISICSVVCATIWLVCESLSPVSLWCSVILIGIWIADAIVEFVNKKRESLTEDPI